jgi:hypothetical protein
MTKRFTVERIRLDSGGYDSRGRYFGTGAPLFSVTDNETDKTTEVRAGSAKLAREKVMQGLFGPPPKNPMHGEARTLSESLYAEALKESSPPQPLLQQYKADVFALASKVRASNPTDRAWTYYDKDIASMPESGRYAMGSLHRAAQMIEGAAERIR